MCHECGDSCATAQNNGKHRAAFVSLVVGLWTASLFPAYSDGLTVVFLLLGASWFSADHLSADERRQYETDLTMALVLPMWECQKLIIYYEFNDRCKAAQMRALWFCSRLKATSDQREHVHSKDHSTLYVDLWLWNLNETHGVKTLPAHKHHTVGMTHIQCQWPCWQWIWPTWNFSAR